MYLNENHQKESENHIKIINLYYLRHFNLESDYC